MPAIPSSRATRTVRPAGAAVAAALVLAAVLGGVVRMMPLAGLPAMVAAVGAAVLVTVLAVVMGRRARRLRRERRQEALGWFDGLHVCRVLQGRSVATEPGDAPLDTVSERALRLQIRTLEQALDGQEQRLVEAARDGQRHALLTLGALRDSLAGQSGDVALGRLEAGLRRLGGTPSFTRPVLGRGSAGAVVLPTPQPLVGTAVPTAPAVQTPTPAEPAPTPVEPAAVTELPDTVPAPAEEPVVPAAPTPGPPVVMPVPAFPARELPHRGRRRFRRTVAA